MPQPVSQSMAVVTNFTEDWLVRVLDGVTCNPDEDVIDDVSISTVRVLISFRARSLKAMPPRLRAAFLFFFA